MSSAPSVSGVEVAGTAVKKGSAWITAKASERSLIQAYSSDPKFKKYVQQVDKCLNTFDDVHEWADCIAFLKQLLKTFQTYSQFKEIPKKLIVAKRLSQCLNPALPTGVHQRALEVYIHILSLLGPEGLKRDLPLWSSGLFPFFEYSATSVKPTLLNIYETHYLPLQGALRPIMKSFTLALLPGLEEETGEFFEKVVGLLDKLSTSASLSFFFQNIWLVMLTTPSARGTSLNYLSRRLPRLNPDEDITEIVGKDIGLMIRAFAAALEDENLLVRRGALDLLLQAIRVDSTAIRKAHVEDRAIIMRAAVGVVLRRDISLNRRLYSWLLGPEERPENPIGFYKEHALGLLYSTLKNEMFSPSGEYAESRPFKIFISLLDKWEIGSPLADILVYDAFKAIKSLMEAHSTDSGEDLMMTASTLYEALEPEILWKPLLSKIFKEMSGDGSQTEAIDLALFILDTFSHDEEIQANHFPTIIAALLDLLDIQLQTTPSLSTSPATLRCLVLLEEILKYTPHLGLVDRTAINPPNTQKEEARETQRPYLFACSFYEIEDFEPVPASSQPASTANAPFTTAFNNLFSLSTRTARMLASPGPHGGAVREGLSRILTLCERLLGRLSISLQVAWDPSAWMNTLLQTFEYESVTFTVVDRVVTLVAALSRSQLLEPRLDINNRTSMRKMVTKLLQYLKTDTTAYHARAVHLICSLETSTPDSHVESVIAQTMASPESRNVAEAYEAFGILWRLSEDSMVPGFRFRVPLMIVLETLKSNDPGLYRIGETWMRCSLKSYLRILDPILFDLLDPSIIRTPHAFKVQKRDLSGYLYERPFDQRLINHLLEVLLSVVTFAGQGFAKAAATSAVKRSHHAPLVQRVEAAFQDANRSYLDVLIEVLLRFIQSEPAPRLSSTMKPLNLLLQSTAVQLLQLIVTRGEFDQALIGSIEAIVIGKLYYTVHTKNLDIQNKLLHLLHSIVSLSIAHVENVRIAASKDTAADPAPAQEKDDSIRYTLNPLMVQTLVDGISVRSNRPVMQHWLDFILGAIPQFQPALQPAIVPLNDCICRQLTSILGEITNATRFSQEYGADLQASATELDLIMLINGLERLVLLGLAYTSEADAIDDDASIQEKAVNESSGLLGYVSTVFSGDGGSGNANEQSNARVPGYRSLDDGIRILYLIWGTMVWKPPSVWSPREESLSLIYNRTRARCRRALEHLFRVQPMEVFESIIDWWNKDTLMQESSPDAAFELVDTLLSTAQNATHMICESISNRISTAANRKASSNLSLTDAVLFKFMEQYFQRLEGPLAIQVWSRFLSLVKDLVTTKEFKSQNFPALRCMSVLSEKVTQTTAMEDKRIRKELQDNYGKLLDSCVMFVGRSSDQGSWIRRSTKEAITSTNGRASPAPTRADSKAPDEKAEDSAALPPDTARQPATSELLFHITSFIARSAVPHLRRFLLENDKVIAMCNNIVYYIVNPAMRGKTRPMDVEPTVVAIITEMTKIPASLKSWRTVMIDLLSDNRVFNSDPEDGAKWRPVVKALYHSDKTAFTELLTKVGAAPSANIFTNKEYEMLLRSLNIRRLSFVLFCGENNSFLTQLPTIQEKLVDVFRNVTSPVVQSEVFLCIRVLLCRLSPHNLTSFWPVVLTELYRIFEQVIAAIPADGSEDLQLVLAACKCLDLLLVLQTEEFQVHQWIFITDTVDAIYRPEDWFPEAMLDQLAEIASSLPLVSSVSASAAFLPSSSSSNHNKNNSISTSTWALDSAPSGGRPMRRPLLGSTRTIDSMRDLVPFFSNVSIASYESVYASGGNIDWEVIERGIMEDLFDGR